MDQNIELKTPPSLITRKRAREIDRFYADEERYRKWKDAEKDTKEYVAGIIYRRFKKSRHVRDFLPYSPSGNFKIVKSLQFPPEDKHVDELDPMFGYRGVIYDTRHDVVLPTHLYNNRDITLKYHIRLCLVAIHLFQASPKTQHVVRKPKPKEKEKGNDLYLPTELLQMVMSYATPLNPLVITL